MDNEISQLEESLTPHSPRPDVSPRPPGSTTRVGRPTPAPRSRASTPQLLPTPVLRGTNTPSILAQQMQERDVGTTITPGLRASTPRFIPTPARRRINSTPSILVQQAPENPAQDAGTAPDQRSFQPPVVPSLEAMGYQPTAGSVIPVREDHSLLFVARELKKPAADIDKFSGDPLKFVQFRRQFTTRIVTNSDSYDETMTFLLQFTTGEAHTIAAGYAHLDAQLGFNATWEEYNRRYGDPEVVAQSYVTKALDWPQIKPDDHCGLDCFGIFLRECLFAIHEVEAVKILEYSENLRRLCRSCPSVCMTDGALLFSRPRRKGTQ